MYLERGKAKNNIHKANTANFNLKSEVPLQNSLQNVGMLTSCCLCKINGAVTMFITGDKQQALLLQLLPLQ